MYQIEIGAEPAADHYKDVVGDQELVRACIAACLECATISEECVAARRADMNVDLTTLHLHRASVEACVSAAKALQRFGPDPDTVRIILEACREACRVCAEECEQTVADVRSAMCAGASHGCERLCDDVLEHLRSAQ